MNPNLKTMEIGTINATILESVQQFDNVVKSTPNYKWLMWQRAIDKETFKPLAILMRYKPQSPDMREAFGKAPILEKMFYAVSLDILIEGEKDKTYR
jgi:hypothetical protein